MLITTSLSPRTHVIAPSRSFEEGFPLVDEDPATGTAAITAPEGTKRTQFLQWADSLPNSQSPAWLGLPANAENVLLTNRAGTMINNMHKLEVRTVAIVCIRIFSGKGRATRPCACWLWSLV